MATPIKQGLPTANGGKKTFSQVIQTPEYKALINNTLRDPARANRFVTGVISAVSATPALQKCEPASVLSAALQGEALNLSPSPTLGEYYMIPYGDKWNADKRAYECYKAQFQLGVAGRIQLAMRTGEYADLDTIEVRQGEFKGRDPKNGKPVFEFVSDEDEREKLPVVGYLAYFELTNGFKHSVYFSREKVLQWADRYSKAFDRALYERYISGEELSWKDQQKCSSPWYERFDTMAENTVLKQCLKRGPKSIEMRRAEESELEGENIEMPDVFAPVPATEALPDTPKPTKRTKKAAVGEDGEVEAGTTLAGDTDELDGIL